MVSENAQTLSDNVSSLMELKITLPLSAATKYLHTNDFIKTEISLPTLQKLAKLDKSYNKNDLNSFTNNVWNISKIDIKVGKNNEEMTLTLSPYAKSTSNEMKTLLGFKETKNKTTNAQTNNNTEITGDAYTKNIVSKAIKGKKDIKAQAAACVSYYQKNHVYECVNTDVVSDYKKSFKTLWEKKRHSCGPGAATLAKMFEAIGLHGQIRYGKVSGGDYTGGHFWVMVEINGTQYFIDQSGPIGGHNSRKLGTSGGSSNVYGGPGKSGSIQQEF